MGLGIIFATIVMTVSSGIHNNNLSNDFIIKEAQKLGMIMPEEDDDGGLWVNDTTESEEGSEVEDITGTESLTETEDGTEIPEATEVTESEAESETASEADSQEKVYYTITITDLDAARHVGEKLYEKGLVSNVEEFRLYLRDQGYANSVRSGTFKIPEGATFEEICDIIVRK